MINPAYEINTNTGTATIHIYSNDILVTTYTYDSNATVTLSELSQPAILSKESYAINIAGILKWINLIKANLDTVIVPLDLFKQVNENKMNSYDASYKWNHITITDATYDPTLQTIEFSPRGEITFSFTQFFHWFKFLSLILNDIKSIV